MLRLSANQEKQLAFEVQIGGVSDFDKVESYFRIVFEGIEYGFPCKVTNESIQVSLPPLNRVIAQRIREGDEVEIKLEVFVDGHYLIPWKDRAKLSNPLVIEAKIKDDDFVKNPSFETKLVSEAGGQTQGVIIKEKEEVKPAISEDFVDQVAGKLKDLLTPKEKVKEQDEMPPEKEEEKEEEKGEEKEKEVEEKSDVVTKSELEKLLTDTIKKFNLTETEKPKQKNAMTLKEFRKNLTTDDIFKYMYRAGTKNKQVQEIVYDQACALAESAEPIEILRQVIKVLKKKK